jgi:salicylate hydroxylase
MRVAIAGAGIGGLTLALALRAHGIDSTIYEQAPEVTEIGAGVALSANATRHLRRFGIDDELARTAFVPTEIVMRDGLDAHAVARHTIGAEYEERFGGPYYGLHRKHLQGALLRAVGVENVRTNRRCIGVTQTADGVELTFEQGAPEHADLVAGADGVHSVLREHVEPGAPPARFSGTKGFRALIPIERLPSLPDPLAIQFWMGPGRHLLHYPIDGGALINLLAVVRTPVWSSSRWLAECESSEPIGAFAGWHPAARELASALTEDVRWALFDRAPLQRWSRGRVVLMGDAAHAMLPHQGQGANQTVEDAVVLADCLASADAGEHEAAFARYETTRARRTARVQAISRRTVRLLHLPPGRRRGARDRELATLPEGLAWIHGHDAQRVGAAV